MLKNQAFLKTASIVMVVIVGGLLASSILRKTDSPPPSVSESVPESDPDQSPTSIEDLSLGSFGSIANKEPDEPSRSDSVGTSSKLTLRVGVIGSTPNRDEVTKLDSLPITEPLIRRAYANAKTRACRMLIPGAPVLPPQSLSPVGQAGTLGRVSTMTIGLNLDAAGRSKLPAVIRGQVDSYLAKHRLSVQPVVYYDKQGHLYFGTDCQAAFFQVDSPGTTVKSEPMIETAVSRFRALGVVGSGSYLGSSDGNPDAEAVLGRTLAMAFQFEKAESMTAFASNRSRFTTELMLLHIPAGTTVQNPEVQLFITSDERKTLNRLNTRGERLNSPIPTISADVRFDKTILMGMYPSDPVVTGIRYRSEGVVSMDAIRRMTEPNFGDGESKGMTVTEVLDQFGVLSGGMSSLAGQRPRCFRSTQCSRSIWRFRSIWPASAAS